MNYHLQVSVRPPIWNNSATSWRIFINCDTSVFFKNLSTQSVSSMTQNIGCFTWRMIIFFIIRHSVLLRMRNVPHRGCRENQNTQFMFSKFFCPKSCRLWKNLGKTVQSDHRWQYGVRTLHAGQMSYKHTLRTGTNYCFSTTTMVAERASMLRYTYIAGLVLSCNLNTLTAERCENATSGPTRTERLFSPSPVVTFFLFVKKKLYIWTSKYSWSIRRITSLPYQKIMRRENSDKP